MLDDKVCGKKQFNMEPYFHDEDEKLIKQKNKINNMIQCEAPLLEKKIKIEENDLKELHPIPKKQKFRLNCLIILGLSISIMTLVALAIMAMLIAKNDDVTCGTAEVEKSELFSHEHYIPVAKDDASQKNHEPHFIRPSITGDERTYGPGAFRPPIIIESPEKSWTTSSTTTTTQKPSPNVSRNNENDCKDGMFSYSIFPDINICASHREVNTEDVAWAVEDCMDIKGHLPKTSDMDELNYLSGLVKDLTRMNHPSPILVKREAKPEDYVSDDGVSIITHKWMLYQPANGSLQMDSDTTNQVGVLCIKPFDQEDEGFFSRVEESMIEMMKTMRERVANIFTNSPFFRRQ